ncbi:ATPase inhibitor subunit zeta [uncultured Alsobacter sp.]|uniref:DUF1476 domain-containing protein n=1 Tax=uncultured Alsobacter sp. TaxID=1748258 RepID=UPI0025EA324B|nr:ATPase inhibitor subunit zeta [uncultured Alsobacter sp.]
MTPNAIDTFTSPDALLLDHDSRAGVVALRNVLLGLWAAGRMGLSEEQAEDYAWSVHFADFDAPGHDDVVGKVVADLQAHGLRVTDAAVRRELREFEQRAALQLGSDPR